MYLDNKTLATIYGGTMSATLLNALSRAISTIYDLGTSIGSSIRRVVSGKTCKL